MTRHTNGSVKRRELLKGIGSAGVAGTALTAGCIGGNTDGSEPTDAATDGSMETTAPGESMDPMEITLGVYYGRDHINFEYGVNHYMEQMTEASDGAITFEVLTGDTIGGLEANYDLLHSGSIDIGFLVPDFVTGYNRHFTASFPGFERAMCEEAAALLNAQKPGGYLRPDFDEAGTAPAVNMVNAQLTLMTTESAGKIESLGDLEGLKIRTSGAAMEFLMDLFGATPTTIPSTETYSALERGLVDGMISQPLGLPIYSWDEQLSYGTLNLPLGYLTSLFPMYGETYESLPPSMQEVHNRLTEEVTFMATKNYKEGTNGAIESADMEWYNVSDGLIQEFNDALADALPGFMEDREDTYPDVYNQFKADVDKLDLDGCPTSLDEVDL